MKLRRQACWSRPLLAHCAFRLPLVEGTYTPQNGGDTYHQNSPADDQIGVTKSWRRAWRRHDLHSELKSALALGRAPAGR